MQSVLSEDNYDGLDVIDDDCDLFSEDEDGGGSGSERHLETMKKLERHPSLVLNADYQVRWCIVIACTFVFISSNKLNKIIYSLSLSLNNKATKNAPTQHMVMARHRKGRPRWEGTRGGGLSGCGCEGCEFGYASA